MKMTNKSKFYCNTEDGDSIMSSSNPTVCKKPKEDGKSQTIQGQSCKKDSRSDDSDICNQADRSSAKRRIWYNELRILKELGLDRAALVANNACKRCLRDERNNLEIEKKFADSVPQSHEELEADMRAFQERVKHQKAKFAYKDPGKYQHLVQ